MGLFDDINRFLESRLEEFLRNNPHLELQALEEQLRQQEEDALRLIVDSQAQEKRVQEEILSTAQEIQRWHERVNKAKTAGRLDLAQAAQEREAALLRQGNQLWGKMQGLKERIEKAKELQRQISIRRQEVGAKAKQAQAERAAQTKTTETTGWNFPASNSNSSGADALEEQFMRWEIDHDLDNLKRNLH
ncbi:MAG TPA: TIGR04376 family protein [Oculatellaceae cyanobacterium]